MTVPRAAWVVGLVLAVCFLWLAEGIGSLEGVPSAAEWVQPSPPQPTGYRLLSHLSEMRVAHEKEGKPTEFRFKDGTFLGPKGLPKWIWVGPVQVELPLAEDPVWLRAVPQASGKAETLCIWAHPTDSGRLVLTWPDAPAGTLSGMLYFLPEADDKAAARIRVLWNGKQQVDLTPVTRHGKSVRFQSNLSPTKGEHGGLRVEVETRVKGRNHLCVDGWIEPIPDTPPESGEEDSGAEALPSDLDAIDAESQDAQASGDRQGDAR